MTTAPAPGTYGGSQQSPRGDYGAARADTAPDFAPIHAEIAALPALAAGDRLAG